MKYIIPFLVVACAGASFVFFAAARKPISDAYWATQICTAAGELCHRPLSLAVAAAALAALWLMVVLASSFVD
jgi:hypothetical protein